MGRTADDLLGHIRGLKHLFDLGNLDDSFTHDYLQDTFNKPDLITVVELTAALLSYDFVIPKHINLDLDPSDSELLCALYLNRERIAMNLNKEIAQLVNSGKLSKDEIRMLRKELWGVVGNCMVDADLFCTEWVVYVFATWWALECLDNNKHNIPPHSVISLIEVDEAVDIWFSPKKMNDMQTHSLFSSLWEGLSSFYGYDTATEFCNKELVPIIFQRKALVDQVSAHLIVWEWGHAISARENVLLVYDNYLGLEEWYAEIENLFADWEDNSASNRWFLEQFLGDSLFEWLHNRESVISGTSLEKFMLNMEHPPIA